MLMARQEIPGTLYIYGNMLYVYLVYSLPKSERNRKFIDAAFLRIEYG